MVTTPVDRQPMTRGPDPRRANRVAAVLMLVAAALCAVAATSTAPVASVGAALAVTAVAFGIAAWGQLAGRAHGPDEGR